jgi:CSLREA domain-containing protein
VPYNLEDSNVKEETVSRPPLHFSFALIPFRVLVVATLLLAAFSFPTPAEASTFVVNTRDYDDDGVCDVTHCSIREAINAANDHAGPDTIFFNIESGTPPFMINLSSTLPALTDDGTTIDGTTMYEYEDNPAVLILGGGDAEAGLVIRSNGNTIRGLMISNFSAEVGGAALYVSGDENLIESNVLISSDNGIYLSGANNEVRGNRIGLRGIDSAAPNTETGIFISGSGNEIIENTIAYNGGPGIQLEDRGTVNRNTFSRNSFHDNEGLAIDIAHNNEDIDAPMISSVSEGEVRGEACRGCTIEVFVADPDPSDYGEGVEFLAEGTADAVRRFTVSLSRDLGTCDEITATATDSLGNTSEFALNWTSPLCMTAATTFFGEPYLTVNTEDDLDDGTCNEEHCSLREAINEANRRSGADTIHFDIPDAAPHQIQLERMLPQLTDDRTTIDGTTEPDYSTRPVVTLSGINGVSTGLRIESSRNTIRGLGFIYFGEAGYDYGWHDVEGAGIEIRGNLNRIEQNLLYLNGDGIRVFGNYNTLTGNQFGTIGSGLADWPNDGHGISVSGDFNQIGGSGPGEGNQIAASGEHGINVFNSEGNRIQGNIIGGDASGEVAVPNSRSGIFTQGVTEIGGLNPGEGNIIIGNGENGVELYDTARDSLVAGNVIHDNAAYGILVDLFAPEVQTFTRNSIYNNGELGIENPLPDDNLLRIDRASLTEVSGFACRGCLVEVFLAEPDPTGFGEGRTFLGEARADIAGSWSVEISGVDRCQEITATATKSGVGTSRFAENALVSCYRLPGAPMAAASALPLLIIVGIILVVRRVRPETPGWWLPGGAGLGLLFGIVMFSVLVFIPGIQLDFGPRAPSPPEPLPGCNGFIDPKSLTPSDGHVFGIDEDPLLAWSADEDLPPGDIQWRVELRLPDQRLITLATADENLPFSTFRLEPQPGGRYEWWLTGEVRGDENAEYLSFCSAENRQTFYFENPLLTQIGQVEQPVEEPTPLPPPEETTCTPSVTASMNATCRYGPDSAFHELGYLLQGENAPANAQTPGAGWFRVLLENKVECWVWSGAVEAVCAEDLPIEQGPQPPTEVPAPPTPVDETAPSAPNTLTPKNTQEFGCVGSVTLTWSSVSDPSGIASYEVRVERSPDQSSWSAAPGSPWSTSNTGQSIPVECGWYYRWRVRAMDGAGNAGSFSPWSTFTVWLE